MHDVTKPIINRIEEIAREMQKERHDRMARKRKNTKEKTESELT